MILQQTDLWSPGTGFFPMGTHIFLVYFLLKVTSTEKVRIELSENISRNIYRVNIEDIAISY